MKIYNVLATAAAAGVISVREVLVYAAVVLLALGLGALVTLLCFRLRSHVNRDKEEKPEEENLS